MEFGQAEAVSVVDEDGVGVGDIEAGLDDGGADEDIGLVADEAEHLLFELVFGHLAVGDDEAGFGDEASEAIGDGGDGLDAVVEEVNLAGAGEFAEDGLADALGVVGADFGEDGAAVEGRGGEGGDAA